MELLARHLILAGAETRDKCQKHVLGFFDQTSLVRYDRIEINDSILCGTDDDFTALLKNGVDKNRKILKGFIEELGNTGFGRRDDISSLEQGYPSKIFHIIAHFLDGFIGIDTHFYNLIDDSHWVTDDTNKKIEEKPEHFWLLSLNCYSMAPREASLLHM